MDTVNNFIDNLDLSVGETYRCDCPSCRGRNTFTVTNDSGNILYNCYKAGCKVSGVSHRNMDAFTVLTKILHGSITEDYTEALRETFTLPPYLTPIKPNTHEVNQFVAKYGINPDHVLYDIRQDRMVFPVYSHEGNLVDAVGRALFDRKPKWLRYASSPIPYTHGKGKTIVIVEDAISAFVVGEFFDNATGMALLGTQLTDFHKWYISNYFSDYKAIIALDPDVLNKTIDMVKELRSVLDDVKGLNLNNDLKYATEHDFKRLEELL